MGGSVCRQLCNRQIESGDAVDARANAPKSRGLQVSVSVDPAAAKPRSVGEVRYFRNGQQAFENIFAGSGAPWFKMLGDTLLTAVGPKPTAEIVKGKKIVALLFADVTCPYCSAFEPVFQDLLKKVKAADPSDTEVVYIPAEVQAELFRGVTSAEGPQPFASMPWETSQGSSGKAGLGFVRKKGREQHGRLQGVLGEKYGVTSVPKLVILDGATGRKMLDGDNFIGFEDSGDIVCSLKEDLLPETWIAANGLSWSGMLGPSLQTSSGLKPTEDVLMGKKQVALYFADVNCPFCSAFEPNLQGAIKTLRANDPSDTEVVYIPAEVLAESFRGVTPEQAFPCMPWETSQGSAGKAGLGFVRKKGREQHGRLQGVLGEQFGISSVPQVYVCDAVSGKVKYSGEKFIVTNEFEENGKEVITMKFDAEEVPPSWKESLPMPFVA